MPDNTNEYVRNLKAEYDRALEEQRAVIDAASAAKRLPSAEEQAVIARTDEAMDAAQAEIDRYLERSRKAREAEEAIGAFEPFVRPDERSGAKGRQDDDARKIEAFIAGRSKVIDVDLIPAARALTAYRQGAGADELRALSIVTAAAGGTLVPTTFATTLLQAMETINGPIQYGCELLDTASGESFVYFTEATAGTAAIVGEGSALAGSDPTFGRLTLGAWKYAELVQVSNELATDSGIDLVTYVARTTGKALARVTTTAFTTGSGSNAPQGFVVGGGNGGTAQTAATGVPSYDNLVDLVYGVSDEAYAGQNSVFTTKFSNMAALRKIKDGGGNYIWERSLAAGQPATLLGYRILSNPNMRAWATAAGTGTIAFGDFAEGYVVRRVGAVRFERSDDYAFNTDQITFRAVMRVDGKVKQAGAIRVLREPTT